MVAKPIQKVVRSRPTSVGRLFVVLMLLFYVACVTSQSGLLLLFVGLVAGCYAVNWNFSRRNAARVIIEVPRKTVLVEGSAAAEPWRITNPSSKHIELLEIYLGEKLLLEIPFLKTGETISVLPNFTYERRGVYNYDDVSIQSTAPYGLLRSKRQLKAEGEVVVLPNIYDVEGTHRTGLELISGGKLRGKRRVHSGTNFAGVRGWQSGDSMKQVHWKSTARRGELMVKTFEEELGGRLSIIIDGRFTGGSRPDRSTNEVNLKKLDDCLRAVASLATAALQEGDHVELVESLTATPFRLAPFSDEGELLERLARYRPDFPMLELHALWRKSSLILAGVEWHEEWREWIDEANAQNRELVIYLPVGTQAPRDLDVEIFTFSEREVFNGWQPQEAKC
jgi:uncharacterized protein (DUF58 family)